jgi:hypothetical protein
MDVPYSEGERWVEVAPSGASTTIALVRARAGELTGIDTQVRLTTRDAEADHADLRARGVDTDTAIIPYPVPVFVLRDPDGNLGPRLTTSCVMLRSWRGTRPAGCGSRGPVRPLDEG